ncbi:MAG: hypothetical protein H6565_09885 [Lewinellaceae bacterium]|nr:hypothetical protein [Saprospiraceae bacterium]MCB9306896.1 hypothetical protein [Lewinellaceae bacterium]MCB9354332.1 hypothetical protein [Lewinellaceae bacterium]
MVKLDQFKSILYKILTNNTDFKSGIQILVDSFFSETDSFNRLSICHSALSHIKEYYEYLILKNDINIVGYLQILDASLLLVDQLFNEVKNMKTNSAVVSFSTYQAVIDVYMLDRKLCERKKNELHKKVSDRKHIDQSQTGGQSSNRQNRRTCSRCWGRGSILCPTCQGTGTAIRNGYPKGCARCNMACEIQCFICNGKGYH